MLPRDVYKALENIVGPENISEDPAVLAGYAFQWFAELFYGDKWAPMPEAVVLPGSTEEVQAIVKICNRYGIRFKAMSTGWGVYNAVTGPGAIQIELRRMNRILDIDEKNMYAVVEPYVTCSQLQVEAMKKGLNCHIIGAGANTSVLASATSVAGYGPSGIYMGYSGRNLLGVEWVLPTGEVLRLGSLGSGAGWFCGDGPGLSLRGIIRGWMGAMGGLGVFTKCAVKLYHWPGPPKMKIEGVTPTYTVEKMPRNFKCHLLVFPSWEKLTEAVYKLGEAEMGYVMARLTPTFTGMELTPSNKAFYDMLQALTELKYSFLLILGASSPRELGYQEKALNEILTETEGYSSPLIESEGMQKMVLTGSIKMDLILRSTFRGTGAFQTSLGASDTWDFAVNQAKLGEKVKAKYIKKGVLMDDGADDAAGFIWEGGTFGYTEEIFYYNPADPKSIKGAYEYTEESNREVIKQSCGIPIAHVGIGDGFHEMFGPACSNYHLWLRKIKKAFDPNNASDPSFYISPEIGKNKRGEVKKWKNMMSLW